ncbi:MAG TPA: spore coat U domain-containing protein [Nevskiales bacterium]|nr:spore coat U domain-containing protein [Nevskiales bacterium]
MRITTKTLVTAAGIALVAPGMAAAATTTTTFQVTATVTSACSVSATNLSFGAYDPTSAIPKDATSTINVTCTLLAPYAVRLSGGGSGDTAARVMDGGTSTDLGYQLYSDALRTTVWGNTGTDDVAGVGGGLVAVPHTVYGRIAAGQDVEPGSYVDTVTVSVDF